MLPRCLARYQFDPEAIGPIPDSTRNTATRGIILGYAISVMNRFYLIVVVFVCMLVPAFGGQRGGSSGRSVIGQTQSDLRRSSQLARGRGKEKDRIQNALRHLSDFDRRMSRGRFDKGILDTAIEDVNNVVGNNTLSPGDRDALTGDLQALRDMRARRGVGY